MRQHQAGTVDESVNVMVSFHRRPSESEICYGRARTLIVSPRRIFQPKLEVKVYNNEYVPGPTRDGSNKPEG